MGRKRMGSIRQRGPASFELRFLLVDKLHSETHPSREAAERRLRRLQTLHAADQLGGVERSLGLTLGEALALSPSMARGVSGWHFDLMHTRVGNGCFSMLQPQTHSPILSAGGLGECNSDKHLSKVSPQFGKSIWQLRSPHQKRPVMGMTGLFHLAG